MAEPAQSNYASRTVRAIEAAVPDLPADLAALYALLALTKGAQTTMRDVHDAWAIFRQAHRPDHPCLVPFEELPPDVQELDRAYMEAIHRAAAKEPSHA